MQIDLKVFLDDMFRDFPVTLEPVAKQEQQFSFFKDHDGVWNLIEKGKILGWVNKITYPQAEFKYRAMSAVTNNMEFFYSLDAARNYLFCQSH